MHARSADLEAAMTGDMSAADVRAIANMRVLVVGTGLIGTSIGMALRRHGTDVLLFDRSPDRLAVAALRGAGRPWPFPDAYPAGIAGPPPVNGREDPFADVDGHVAATCRGIDHVVFAVPPREVGQALVAWQHRLPGATFSDTASVKVRPLTDAERLGADMSLMCGAHPVAGRERGGPEWAVQELFINRSWVITPSSATSELACRHARLVALGCGASVVQLDPQTHDFALGLLSHLPHLVASAVAARVATMPEDLARLAGPGLMDFTRIAGANADLWTEIVEANASPLAHLLAGVIEDLDRVRDALGATAVDGGGIEPEPVVESLFRLGNTGRNRLEAARSVPGARLAAGSRAGDHEELVPA